MFNAITDVIEKLESALSEGAECLQMLKEAQKTAEEMNINEIDEK